MEDPISYAVVRFFDASNSNGKILVELVPKSWILESEDITQCRWPPSHFNKYIQKWIEEAKPPVETWSKYDIEILTTANNYEQGLRRLKRSCKRATQLSSSESEKDSTRPTVLSRNVASQLLNQTKSLSDLSTITEHTKELESCTGTLTNPTKKSSKSFDEQINVLRSQIDNDLKEFIADYIDAKNEILLSSITNSIISAKRSLQYDLDKKLEALKLCFHVESKVEKKPALRSILEMSLPIKNIDDFLKFENSLTINLNKEEDIEKTLEKQKALKCFYEIITAGSNNYEADIKTIVPNIITKAVQLEYSGIGRVVHGISKRNFSQTMVYQCMKEFLEEKYVNPSTQMKILTITSRYLSGAGDREGGYMMRKNKSNTNN